MFYKAWSWITVTALSSTLSLAHWTPATLAPCLPMGMSQPGSSPYWWLHLGCPFLGSSEGLSWAIASSERPLSPPCLKRPPLDTLHPLSCFTFSDSSLPATMFYFSCYCQSPPLGWEPQERRDVGFVVWIVLVYHTFSVPEQSGREKALDG